MAMVGQADAGIKVIELFLMNKNLIQP